jgi:membrane protein implicated in regulation of membrane protease activity
MSRARLWIFVVAGLVGSVSAIAFVVTVGFVYLFLAFALSALVLYMVVDESLKIEKAKHLQTVNTEESQK